MTERELRTFLDQVKPVGLTILFVMANLVIQQVDITRVARVMRTTRQRLAPHFDQLVDHGFVAEVPGGRHPRYRLTEKVKQLSLFDLTALSGMVLAGQPAQSENPALTGMVLADQPAPGESSDCDVSNYDVNKINVTPASVVVVDQAIDLARSQQQQQQQVTLKKLTSDSDRRAGVLRACVEVGIGYPASRDLATDEWVTPDRVLRAVRQCVFEGRWDNPVGQAIRRLEDHFEPMTDVQMDALEAEEQREERERREAIAREQPDRLGPEPAPGPAAAPALPHPSLAQPIHGSMKPGQVWQAALGELQLQMTKPTFETWVKPCQVVAYEWSEDHREGEFIVGAPTALLKDWLERKLLSSIRRSLAGILGHSVEVTFVVTE